MFQHPSPAMKSHFLLFVISSMSPGQSSTRSMEEKRESAIVPACAAVAHVSERQLCIAFSSRGAVYVSKATSACLDGINERIRSRSLRFLEPAVTDILCRIYGLRPVPLGIDAIGYELYGYRIQRPFVDRFVLAPFNFQPVLPDLNDEIAATLVHRAREAGPKATSQIKLHHSLDPRTVSRLGLEENSASVETLVDLTGGETGMLANMRPRHRSKLRHTAKAAAAAGITVAPFRDQATLDDVFRVMLKAYRDKHHMIPQPASLFSRLMSLPDGAHACVGYAAREPSSDRVVGGIIILKDDHQWCYGWGATDAAYADFEIGTLLIGEAMFDAVRAGVPVFNLGASPKSHETLRRYKRGWGGGEHDIRTYYFREKPETIDLHEGYPLAKMVIKRAPLGLIRTAAPLAVRWLV